MSHCGEAGQPTKEMDWLGRYWEGKKREGKKGGERKEVSIGGIEERCRNKIIGGEFVTSIQFQKGFVVNSVSDSMNKIEKHHLKVTRTG